MTAKLVYPQSAVGTLITKTLLAATMLLSYCGLAMAQTVEVTASGSNYRVTLDGAQTYLGNSFTAAMQNAAGNGNRTINVRVGGATTAQVRLFSNTTLNWLTSSYWDARVGKAASRAGAQIYANGATGIRIVGLRMNTGTAGPGYGIRLSNCPGARIENVDMDWRGQNVFVGIRIDNESSSARVNGLYIRNVNVRNTPSGSESHGVETYGINNVDISGIQASNIGGCACLVQDGSGGTVGSVTGTRCGWGTGYATMRFANGYSNCSVASVTSDGQSAGGRGLFILNSSSITVTTVNIRNQASQGIYIQGGSNNRVNGGSVSNSVAPRIDASPGSSISVSQSGNR